MKVIQAVRSSLKSLSSIAFVLLSACVAMAGSNQTLVYQGRIIRPDGSFPNSGNIPFTLSIYSPRPSHCLLYSETQNINMAGAKGLFSLNLGAGVRTDSGSHTFSQIFVNGSTLSGLTCATGTSYTAAGTDDREMVVSFNDDGDVIELSAMAIKSTPFALQAHEIDGWGLNNLVKVSTFGSPTTFTLSEMANVKALGGLSCALNEIPKWNGLTWVCGANSGGAAAGDSSYAAKGLVQFDTDVATSGITVASGIAKLADTSVTPGIYGSAAKVSTVTVDSKGRLTAASETAIALPVNQLTQSGASVGQVLKWNGSAWAPAADAGITSESDPTVSAWAKAAPAARLSTTGNVLDLATSGVTAATYGSATEIPIVTVDSYGRVTSVTTASVSGGGGSSPVGSALTSGKIWVGDSSNQAAAVAISGDAAITSSGSLSVNKIKGQALAGNAPSPGSLLVYNNSMAQWEAQVLPSCSSSETLNFNSVSGAFTCVSINNATNFTGSLAGDVTGTQGATTLSKIQSKSLTITSVTNGDILQYNGTSWVNRNIPTCGANQYLTFNGTSYSCATDSTGSAPGDATYAAKGIVQFNNDATTSGISLSSGVAAVNTGTGANQIVKLDASAKLPAIDASALTNLSSAQISSGTLTVARGGTGASSFAAGSVIVANTSGSALQSLNCTSGQVITFDSSGYAICGANGSASGFINGGNSFAANAALGTNDNFALDFKTNNSTRVRLDSSGKVGVGTTSPSHWLTVGSGTGSSAITNDGLMINFASADPTVKVRNSSTSMEAFLTTNSSLGGGVGTATNHDMSIVTNNALRLTVKAGGNVGIGTTSPGAPLDVKGAIRLSGATSGYVGFQPAAAAGSTVYILPSADGTSGQFLKTDGAGNLSWGTASSGTPGDATYAAKGIVQFNTDAATSGISLSSGVATVNTGTAANQIVKLDSSARLPAVDGSALTNLTVNNVSAGTLSIARGGTNSSTALNNNRMMVSAGGAIVEAPAMTNGQLMIGSTGAAPAVGSLGSSNGINITVGAGSISIGSNATSANTASTIVARDASGNFAAGDVSVANLSASGNATITGDATAGAVRATKQVSSTSFTGAMDAINWNNGNVQTTSSTCQALAFTNMNDGGTYTLVVTDTGTAGCVFPASINGGTAVTWRGQPTLTSHVRTSSSHTVYTMLRVGTIIYVSWITGF